ncbi:MAG: capsule polysaccharide export protein KpsE/RkpR [Methylophagaceae bacterium]|jgi:capsule polysaccharide export protein KpsE/RkpR
MSNNNELVHAEQVVEHFKATLPKSINKLITKKHYDELTLMIETAINVSVVSILEQNARKLETLMQELRSQQKDII